MLLVDIYKEIKNYLRLQVIEAAMNIKIEINKTVLEKSNYQLVKEKNRRKNSLEKSNLNLIKEKEGKL